MPAGTSLPETLNPAETAILYIDIQEKWTWQRTRHILPLIERFAVAARTIGMPSYWIGHNVAHRFDRPTNLTTLPKVGGLQGVHAHDAFLLDLHRHGGHIVGKEEPNAFSNTSLRKHLRAEGISNIVACGYIAGQCVASTLIGARHHGFAIGMLSDLSADNNPDGSLGRYARERIQAERIPQLTSHNLLRRMGRHQSKSKLLLAKR